MDISKLTKDQLDIAIKVGEEAKRQGLNPDFVLPMVFHESGFNQNATSKKGALGVMQLMPDTARGLNVDPTDTDQNIRGGVALLKELIANPKIGNDPYKVIAGYNTSTETRNKFLESGDLATLPKETLDHMINITTTFGGDLPVATLNQTSEPQANPEVPPEADGEIKDEIPPPAPSAQKFPRAIAGGAGALAGTGAGASAGLAASRLRVKYDVARMAASYPEALAALKAGKSPAEVMDIVLKGKANAANLPAPQGPLEGNPAGGYQTQNWVASGDTQGRYTDVGLNARDKAEAHQMKLKAMAAEDKIRQIAPEMRPDPNRANLFIPESAGRGPSPRFGGTPNVPIPSAAPVAETSTVMGNIANVAKNYLPYVQYPLKGALTGLNVGQGIADVYNKIVENKPIQAGLSAIGTSAGTAMPFVGTGAATTLAAPATLIPAFLALQNDPEAKKRYLEQMHGKGAFAHRGFGLD